MKTKVVNVINCAMYMQGAIDCEGRTPLIEVVPGLRVILCLDRYVGPSNCRVKNGTESWWFVDYASHPDGIAGNMDPSQRALEGWRGTTNDWACYAHGVWEVVSVGPSRLWEERPEPRYDFGGVRKVRVELRKVA